MGIKPDSESTTIYQFKIVLRDVEPVIWRRFQTRNDITLRQFHKILQAVMGWEDCHLYQFIIDNNIFGPKSVLEIEDMIEDSTVRLDMLNLTKSTPCKYVYDFGDYWQHDILLEETCELDSDKTYPVCIEGENACPPEDSGGPFGYAEKIEIVKEPSHEDYQEISTWLGDDFNPTWFDIEKVNQSLKQLK